MAKKKSIVVDGNIYVAGVYALCTKDGKVVYVGSSIELGDALSRHNYNCRRGKYYDTNKRLIQECFDREDLVFKVLHVSAFNDEVREMSNKEKENLQKALAVLEETYIHMYRKTVCNKITKVTKFSTSPTTRTTLQRRKVNLGRKNPNCKYDEELVSNILYLKNKGFKPKQIAELLEQQGIDVNTGYISKLGVYRWIHIEGKRPEWFNDESRVC